MYLPVPPQPDCVSAWREAVRLVNARPGHHEHNVLIDVADPLARADLSDPVVALVDAFLKDRDTKRIETVANTIFPAALYRRYGSPAFFTRFTDNVLPKVRSPGKKSWSGYYFERMMQLPQPEGDPLNQLTEIIGRLKDPAVRALKLIGDGDDRRLALTAMYRNHYYIEKLLGNLIGLGRLQQFVAEESGIAMGPLTILSTHATIDVKNGKWNRGDIADLLTACDQAKALAVSA
jgi:hypothetical protein